MTSVFFKIGFLAACVLTTSLLPTSLWAQATGTLAGTVIDASTHGPVARVLVDASAYGAVLTDNAGRFSFANVPLGTAQVSYRRPGFFDALTGSANGSRNLAVGTTAADQTLAMLPAASLHGQLALSDGDTPVNMRVNLYRAQVIDGRRHWQTQQTATVHADGSFSFDSLSPGSYIVHGEASLDPAPGGMVGRVRSGYAPAFAPDTGDINTATVYTLQPGEIAEARLRLARVPFYPVTIAMGDEGAGNVQIVGNGFTDWTPRYQREDDALTTELPSGSYTLRAQGGRQSNVGELNFHVDGAPVSGSSLTMSAAPPITIVQTIAQDAAGSTPAGLQAGSQTGSQAVAAPHLSELTFLPVSVPYLSPINESVQFDEASQSASLRRSVPPGQYWVTGRASGGYIASLTSGGADLFTQPLVITPGTSPAIEATLKEDTGAVSVTRAGEVLARPCIVQLLPLEPGGSSSVTTASTTASSGGETNTIVSLSNVPPGDYLLLALASNASIAYRAPGVLQALRGTRVTVTPGGAAQATVSSFTQLPPAIAGAH